MDRKLTDFVAVLRRHGVRVAAPEAVDAARAVTLVGFHDRLRFRDALRATLAKSEAEQAILDACFEAFFRVEPATPPQGPTRPLDPEEPRERPPSQGQGSGSGGDSGQGRGEPVPDVPPSALGEDLLAADDSALALRLAQAATASGQNRIRVLTQKGLFARRLLLAMGLDDLEREIAALEGGRAAGAAMRATLLRERLLQLRQRVRDTVERNYHLLRDQGRDAAVRETDIALLRESDEVRAVVRRLARKLVARHRRRERLALRGRLDVRATLRRNVAHDGVLMDPRWRQVRKDRPRVVAVCDISGSVSQYSRFLLLFLYSLQEVIPRLRTFVFTSTMHEVTGLFAQQDIGAALDTVMEQHGLGSSDYGRSLAGLEQLALRDIDRRSTLLVLGDARNNRGEPRLDLLRRFGARARQLIWLNPEDRARWGSGDSEMLRYATACSRTLSCRTLAELERIVDRLLRAA